MKLTQLISAVRDVIQVLEKFGTGRKPTNISKIVVQGSSVDSVNKEYHETSSDEIPIGFDKVCKGQGWPTQKMWKKLNDDNTWYKADNDAYIYWNTLDSSWWIDKVKYIKIEMLSFVGGTKEDSQRKDNLIVIFLIHSS